ncbi:MAG: hypothetical protein ACJ79K_07455 [Gemmatimonadaceae bacterium]
MIRNRLRSATLGALTAVAVASAACARARPATLNGLCNGAPGDAHIAAWVDRVTGPGGPALSALRGTRFVLRISLFAVAEAGTSPTAGHAGCSGTSGAATFSGDIPDRLRTATSAASAATWRIEGDTVLLDLNPRVRDNNVFVVLPLDGTRGHWGLSTFAGEVAGGRTEPIP